MSSNNLNESEVAVVLGETAIVIIPLADAVAEYLRLRDLTDGRRNGSQKRVYAALELTLGSLVTGDGASKLYDALR